MLISSEFTPEDIELRYDSHKLPDLLNVSPDVIAANLSLAFSWVQDTSEHAESS
jgi:hypothetical protein